MSDPTHQQAAEDLRSRVEALVAQLQSEQAETVPADEPYLASDSSFKRGTKRGVFRLTRHATRRYDRLATELAMIATELARQLESADRDIDRLRGDIDRLDHALVSLRASDAKGAVDRGLPGSAGPTQVPDDYYWAFEARMRGSSDSVVDRLRRYEPFAVPLRDALAGAGEDEGSPLWLDLGCGLGEFCELVREWGWRVEGVDSSPAAVEACRAKGIAATLADAGGFLATRRDEAPGAISAIQVIEHLPRAGWIELFERAHAVLAPGGAMLVETINGLNPEAVTAYFVADVTHTWPGHPDTLALMAEHAGFERVEVVFLNPDQRGNAQDFAIWAGKASVETGLGSSGPKPGP
jgi:predicted TPR repeat methyltransferase